MEKYVQSHGSDRIRPKCPCIGHAHTTCTDHTSFLHRLGCHVQQLVQVRSLSQRTPCATPISTPTVCTAPTSSLVGMDHQCICMCSPTFLITNVWHPCSLVQMYNARITTFKIHEEPQPLCSAGNQQQCFFLTANQHQSLESYKCHNFNYMHKGYYFKRRTTNSPQFRA